MDSGRPTINPYALSFRAIVAISVELAVSFPRFKLPYGEARVRRTSDNARPIVFDPGSMPITRWLPLSEASKSLRLKRAMWAVMVRPLRQAKEFRPYVARSRDCPPHRLARAYPRGGARGGKSVP